MSEEKLDRIESTLEKLGAEINRLGDKVEKLDHRVEKLDLDVRIINERVDTYQKASTQVVNLAFGLIVAASLAIIVPIAFGR